jgi:glycosyltransferase involved in cell wall biosynthesis
VPERPFRVAVVSHTAQLGGAERSLLRLVSHYDPERVRPTVVLGADGPLVEQLDRLGIEVLVRPLDRRVGDRRKDALDAAGLAEPAAVRLLAGSTWKLAGELRRRRVDLVHTNSLKAHVWGGVAGRIAGARVLWHVRDHIAPPYLPPAAARAVRALARTVPNRVVAVSASVAQTVGVQARVVHQGVRLPELNGARPATGPVRVGLVGRIAPWKGQDVFIAAAEVLAASDAHVEFVLVGAPLFHEDAFEQTLRRRVERAGLAGLVHFLGFRADVWSVLRGLDVAVHASTLPEPYGNVVLEAMASRTPIVAAAAGGVLELVEHGRTGILVPPGDPVALAAALERLVADPRERERLGKAGRAHVERHFPVTRDAEAAQSIYAEMLR